MERLTEKNEEHYIARLDRLNGKLVGNQMCLDRLGEYENLEEQGLLIKLPCRVGDIIWDNDYGVPTAYEITGYSFGESDGCIEYPASKTEIVFYFSNTSGSITGSFALSEIGKSLFLTQAEAEAKLKELRGNQNGKV